MMNTYWAGPESDSKRLVSHVHSKVIRTSETGGGYSSVYDLVAKTTVRNMASYYSPMLTSSDTGTSLGFTGDMGELILMKVPVSRTYIRQFCSLVTKDRLSVEALVDVTDKSAQETAKIGKALAQNMIKVNGMDKQQYTIIEKSAVCGNAFYSILWDEDCGDDLATDPTTGITQKTGDNVITVHPLNEITYDFSIEDHKNLRWVVIAKKKNRYDLAARYPDVSREIMGSPSCTLAQINNQSSLWKSQEYETDFIFEYNFFHVPSSACPRGRHVRYVSATGVISDTEYPEPTLPFRGVILEPIQDSGLGYAMLSSLLPLQEITDATLSAITSNQLANSGTIIAVPEGSGVAPEQITKALKIFPYKPIANVQGGGMPTPMSLSRVDPQFFEFSNTCIQLMDQVSMINQTLRGSPPSNVTSGAMAATLIASSMEFLSTATQAHTLALEDILTIGIKNYQRFGTPQHLIEIAGQDNTVRVLNFKKENIQKINRIKLRQNSSIMQTTAGRMTMGESLLKAGLADAKKFVNLVEGAPVEELYEDQYDSNQSVKSEIEGLLNGETVAPHIMQDHPAFIRELKRLLDNSTNAVNNPKMQEIMTLVEQHLNMEQMLQSNQLLFNILRGQPPPPPAGGQTPGQMIQPSQVPQAEQPNTKPANPAKPIEVNEAQ